jgi:O-antigen ligase
MNIQRIIKNINKIAFAKSVLIASPFLYFACIPKFILWRGVITPDNGLFIYPIEWILLLLITLFCKKRLRPIPLIFLGCALIYSTMLGLASPTPIISLFASFKLVIPILLFSQLSMSELQLKYLFFILIGYLIFTTLTVLGSSLNLFSYYSVLHGAELISEGGLTKRGFSIGGGPTLTAMAIFVVCICLNLISKNLSSVLNIILIIGLTGILFTFSRGGLYSIVLSIILIFYFNKSSGFILQKLITLFLVIGVSYSILNFSDVYQFVRGDYKMNENILADASGRFWRYEQAVETSYENLFIGLGGNRYYADSLEFYKKPNLVSISSPHNVYLLLLVEHGLFVMFSFIGLFLQLIWKFHKSGKYRQLMPVIVLLIFSFQVELIFITRPLIYLFSIMLLLAYLISSRKRILFEGRPIV